jgi:hypothetical protein
MAVWHFAGMNKITSKPTMQLRRMAVKYGKSAYAVGMSTKSCVSIVYGGPSAGAGNSPAIYRLPFALFIRRTDPSGELSQKTKNIPKSTIATNMINSRYWIIPVCRKAIRRPVLTVPRLSPSMLPSMTF